MTRTKVLAIAAAIILLGAVQLVRSQGDRSRIARIATGSGMMLAQDMENRWVLLCGDAWSLRYFEQRNPGVELGELPYKE